LRKVEKTGGFSILELVAAITIFSVGILTVVVIFHKGILQTGILYEEEVALESLESIIEGLRAKGPLEIEGETEIMVPESLQAAKSLHDLHISLSVRDFNPQKSGGSGARTGGLTDGLKEITLRLSWQNFGRRARQVTLTTLMVAEAPEERPRNAR
jgi:type II secretory pathway pseudopilin PulG